jgi:hypothetical protein
VRLEGLGQLQKSSDLIGNQTRDLSAFSIVEMGENGKKAGERSANACRWLILSMDSNRVYIVRM